MIRIRITQDATGLVAEIEGIEEAQEAGEILALTFADAEDLAELGAGPELGRAIHLSEVPADGGGQ